MKDKHKANLQNNLQMLLREETTNHSRTTNHSEKDTAKGLWNRFLKPIDYHMFPGVRAYFLVSRDFFVAVPSVILSQLPPQALVFERIKGFARVLQNFAYRFLRTLHAGS